MNEAKWEALLGVIVAALGFTLGCLAMLCAGYKPERAPPRPDAPVVSIVNVGVR